MTTTSASSLLMSSPRKPVRYAAVEHLASNQGGVVSRRQLYDEGVQRWQTKAQVRARRWKPHHKQTIAIHTGPLPEQAKYWSAVFEAGSRSAIDGASALIVSGLKGYEPDAIRISLPRGAKVLRSPGVDVRQTRRFRKNDLVGAGVPRVRTEIAAIRAALWARTYRQAALILTMTVQQRLVTAEMLARALLDVRRDKRRRFIESVLMDLLGGVQSMGELDFTGRCRLRGLPEPDRQVVRKGKDATYFLDVYWAVYRVVLEVDGIHHLHATNVVEDALRQNHVSIDGDTVLRLPLLGLRVAEEEFFDQIRTALRRGGWRGSVAGTAQGL
ncbi:MAG: hypothetical protein ACXWDJ_03270 [Aeromicrobium sp.]